MMNEEKGKWEEVIRSKIYDFEAVTNPEDWKTLSAKLSGGKTVRLIPYRKIFFTAAAAAAVIALVVIGGLYIFSGGNDGRKPHLAIENQIPQIEKQGEIVEKPVENVVENVVEKPVENLIAAIRTQEKKTGETDWVIWEDEAVIHPTEVDKVEQEFEVYNQPVIDDFQDHEGEILADELTIEQSHIAVSSSVTKRRRWGFGVGGGGITAGSTSGSPAVAASSRLLKPDDYMFDREEISLRAGSIQNATLIDPVDGIEFQDDNVTGKVKHKTPVSGGLGISYYLSDRWTLHSGAVYTLLRSNGSYIDDTGNPYKWNQHLHFIGVPLSASYSIAEWKRINFYVTAGGMGEWNVAGKIKRTAKVEGLDVITSQTQRMNQPLWSVHSRAGAVYPVWKFINVYAEAGASYYFDNKSNVVTIRSDKPFNVSLQAGIRLGF